MPTNMNPTPLIWKTTLKAEDNITPLAFRGNLGSVPVAIIEHHSHGDLWSWAIQFFLPGIQTPQSGFNDIDDARTAANDEINAWLEAAGLEVSDVSED